MPETSKDRPVVMVSSTARDLPERRKQVLDAYLRQNTTPKMQEHLPASGASAESGAEAVRVSLTMVDEAEIRRTGWRGVMGRRLLIIGGWRRRGGC